MHRIILTAVLCLAALTASPVWPSGAVAGVTGAKVVFLGEMGKAAAQAPLAGTPPGDIAGGPGIRFGMELVPEGAPQGAPVVLEARLKRPGDPEDAPPIRWLVAARIGIPVMSVWEFAYDWEVEPGVWTMTVSHEDAVIATASFPVIRPDPQAQTPPNTAEPAGPGQDKKTPAPVSAKPQAAALTSGDAKAAPAKQPESPKPETPRQEPSAPGAAKQPEPPRPVAPPLSQDRPPKPLAEFQTPGAPAPKAAAGPPGKRVQALVGGVYSEEARALWVASFLMGHGVKACVRLDERGGKKRWSVVAGWRDTPEEAKRAKEELTPVVGEITIVPMSAADLEKGLQCR